jgi:hypothetical protein
LRRRAVRPGGRTDAVGVPREEQPLALAAPAPIRLHVDEQESVQVGLHMGVAETPLCN